MTTAILFSRQNDTGALAHTLALLEKPVLVPRVRLQYVVTADEQKKM